MALTLKRWASQSFTIGNDVRVTIFDAGSGAASINITAPENVKIWRDELKGPTINGKLTIQDGKYLVKDQDLNSWVSENLEEVILLNGFEYKLSEQLDNFEETLSKLLGRVVTLTALKRASIKSLGLGA
ncbi:MAG: hypothetical protein CL489_06305 [Acidobacteria bacterium]|nr:hypothetical protein [Acidobacteriota bacterium]|tara:strand:- start:42210 stop:42596 length:387 start_codon:yes stop_codon:yes gene_type:complete